MLKLDRSDFPDSSHFERMAWCPVILRPILGSAEQFVVAVVAVSASQFFVARANRLDRLHCLYGDSWMTAQAVVEVAIDELERDLAQRSFEAISDYHSTFSSVYLGAQGLADGVTPEAVATSWLSALTALYTRVSDAQSAQSFALEDGDGETDATVAFSSQTRDPLPNLVWELAANRSPTLSRYFSPEIRERGQRRRRSVHNVIIDFAGSRVVANFGTLAVGGGYAASIDRLKRRLWDLKIDRDNERVGLTARAHELIIHRPSPNEIPLTPRQHDRIGEALQALEDQADQEEIRVRPLYSIGDICDHLHHQEVSAAP